MLHLEPRAEHVLDAELARQRLDLVARRRRDDREGVAALAVRAHERARLGEDPAREVLLEDGLADLLEHRLADAAVGRRRRREHPREAGPPEAKESAPSVESQSSRGETRPAMTRSRRNDRAEKPASSERSRSKNAPTFGPFGPSRISRISSSCMGAPGLESTRGSEAAVRTGRQRCFAQLVRRRPVERGRGVPAFPPGAVACSLDLPSRLETPWIPSPITTP